jgi:lipoprotein-anchoring transpeptidase ErfK/SrfK
MFSARTVSGLALALLLLVACGREGGSEGPTAPASSVAATTPDPSSTTTSVGPLYQGFAETGEVDGTLVALASEGVEVFSAPASAEPMIVLPKTTILGTTTVLALVDRPVDGWAEVMLPVRPNGTTGWISLEAVELYVVDGRIEIDLSERQLVYSVGGEERFRSTVAVGTASNPTPTGLFFVTDRVRITNSAGPWGPNALGLSARSDTVTEFNGGDGIVGIHGTSRPSSIGQAASLGCVRLPNDMIALLHSIVPIGTPVEIVA